MSQGISDLGCLPEDRSSSSLPRRETPVASISTRYKSAVPWEGAVSPWATEITELLPFQASWMTLKVNLNFLLVFFYFVLS